MMWKWFCTESYAIEPLLKEDVDMYLQSEDSDTSSKDETTEAGSHVRGAASRGLDAGGVATNSTSGLGGAGGERRRHDTGGVDSSGVVGDGVGGRDRGGNGGDNNSRARDLLNLRNGRDR
jgi:hypothetical protein